tara:strand:- start:2582 stop:3433 length:852 start_codon:yes stop_codon:yes gene_type:complete
LGLLKFFTYSNLYVSVVIAALLLQTYWLTDVEIDPELAGFVIASTIFLYPLHRIIGAFRIDEFHRNERMKMVLKNQFFMWLIIFVGAVFSVYFFFHLSSHLQMYIIPFGLISVGYTVPFLNRGKKLVRLRDLPGIKIYLIAITVAFVTVLLPLVDSSVSIEERAILTLARIVEVIAVTIPFDIRDFDQDRRAQLKTLPLLLGWEKAKSLALVLLTFFSVLNFGLYFFFDTFSLYTFIALFISDQYAAVMIRKSTPEKSELFFSLGVEGIYIVQTLLVLGSILF